MNIEKINRWFGQLGQRTLRFKWLLIAVFVLLFSLGIGGLQHIRISTSWDDYFLEDDPILVKTEEFKEVFGNDNFVAVLTNCDNTFTKKNLSLIRELSNELLDSIIYSDKITSLTDIEYIKGTEEGMNIEQIVPEIIPSDSVSLSRIQKKAYSKPHIANRLISKDGKMSWILLKLLPFPDGEKVKDGNQTVSPEMKIGKQVTHILNKKKYQVLNPQGAGMPYISYQKMSWLGKEASKTMGIAIIIALFILTIVTKSLRGVLVPIITSISSIIMVYGSLGYIGLKIDSGMMVIPMLLAFAVAIAYNIHLYSFFKRQYFLHGQRKRAVIEAVQEMGWPILFSALTTLSALLSFLVIPVIPLHFVGIATSSCILLTFFIVIFIMPISLSFGKNRKVNTATIKKDIKEHTSWIDRSLDKLCEYVVSHRNSILISSIIVTVFLLIGATKIQTAFDIENTMGRKVPYVNELLNMANSELGSMYAYDVLIDFNDDNKAKDTENLQRLEKLEKHVETFPLTKRTTSILNIIKDLNQTLHENKIDYYTIPANKNQVAQLLLLYENAGGTESEYWIDYDYKRLRLMVELENYNSAQAERELQDVTTFAKDLFPNAKVTTVGSLPQFTAMMQYVVRGQLVSFAIALGIITLLLIIVFGKIKIGLVGIIPNIAPAIVVGGIMGWLDIPLDMMSATIIPMILGLAVDDTIHFINHTHLEFDRKANYRNAIKRSFLIVGSPLILTTLIISSNFSTYMISDAKTFYNMGMLSVAGMASALLADLFLTPILIEKFEIFNKHKK